MTPTTYTELRAIAQEAAARIALLDGEADTFQIDGDTLSAVIDYRVEVDEVREVSRETVIVEGVYDETGDNDAEAAAWLAKQLN